MAENTNPAAACHIPEDQNPLILELQVSESQPTVSALKICYLNPAHNRFSAHQTLLDARGTYRAAGHMSTGLEQCVTLQIGAHQALIQSNTIIPT